MRSPSHSKQKLKIFREVVVFLASLVFLCARFDFDFKWGLYAHFVNILILQCLQIAAVEMGVTLSADYDFRQAHLTPIMSLIFCADS